MSAVTLCGQAVYAILPSGSYAVAGHSTDMTIGQATELLERTDLGSLRLKAGKAVVAVMNAPEGFHYLIGAAPGQARDPSGRPWVYRRVIIATDHAFQSVDCNPFAVEQELLRQQQFLDRSELPRVDLLEISERSPEFERRCLVGQRPLLGPAVISILRGRPVLWSNCAEALALIRAAYVLLPSRLRARLTFSSDAAAWPRLHVQVIASTHPLHGPDPLVADREEIEMSGSAPPAAPSDAAGRLWNRIALTLSRWIERNELAGVAEWRRVADAYLEELPLYAPWTDVLSRLEEAWACAEAAVVPLGERPSEGFRERIRRLHSEGIQPPSVVLASLMAGAEGATVDDVMVTLKACRPTEIESLAPAVAERLVAASLTEASWNAFLEFANDLAPGAGTAIAKAAAPMLVASGQHLSLVRAVSRRAPGGWMWAQAFRAAWDADRIPWDPVLLLRATLYVDEDHRHTTPDAAFLRRVRDHYSAEGKELSPTVALLYGLADADEAPAVAAERLIALLPCSPDVGDMCARAFIWLLSQQQTRADLNTVLDRIRQAPPALGWMREAYSPGSDSGSAFDRAAVALLTLDASELGQLTLDANPDLVIEHVVRLARSAARCCGAFAFPGPLAAAFSRDGPLGGSAWIVEELNNHPSAVEALVVNRGDVELFDRIARFAGSTEAAGLTAVARGSLLRSAFIVATKSSAGRKSLAGWVRCVLRKGVRLVADDQPRRLGDRVPPEELSNLAAETAVAAIPILDASEARKLVYDLAMMVGPEARARWFERSSKALAREVAALQELCRASRARREPRLKATMILEAVARAEGLPWWLHYGIWRLLPRAWLGVRKLGFK